MAERYTLLGCRGCGSVIVESAFRIAGIPYDYEEVDYDTPGAARDRLFSLNPLGQVPTLIMPDGSVMTESVAIIFMLDDKVPEAALVAPPGSGERNAFLRWIVFMVAAVYPTWTYGDDPKKWLPGVLDPMALRTATDRHREKLWNYVEHALSPDPWFLGRRFSALDLYVGAMVHWRPRQEWFARACPKLTAIANKVAELPAVGPLYREQFG
jgi:GST-like protein